MVVLVAFLSGCGFHPVYAPQSRNAPGAQGELGQVQVALISERSGQLLRQALQQRMDRGEGLHKKYELSVSYTLISEQLGFQIDTSVTRQRVRAVGNWSLKTLDTGVVVASGVVRSLDGFDILNQQYFAADIANESAQRRLADNVASQITLAIATFLDHRVAAG